MTITEKENEIDKAKWRETLLESNKMDSSKSGTQAFQKELYSCVSMCIKQKEWRQKRHIMTTIENAYDIYKAT